MLVPRLAPAGAVAAVVLTGCSQPSAANDNPNPLPEDRPVAEPTIIRTPTKVDEAPLVVPLPGPTGGLPGEDPEPRTSFSPGPDGEGEQAETSEQGPDGT